MSLGLASAFVLAACDGGEAAKSDGSTSDSCDSADCEETSSGEPSSSSGEPGPTSGGVMSDEVPCDVANVLAQNCGSCHGAEPAFGAPMSLQTVTDFSVPAITDPATDVSATVIERLNDLKRPMPPDGSMTDADKELLEGWIAGGLQANDGPMCEIEEPDDDAAVGPDELPCEPTAIFRAFGEDTEKFAVPDVDDLYVCFTFDSPFGMEEQGTAWAPIIDDERVVHHYLLLKTDSPDYVVGTAQPCAGIALDAQTLMSWGPGTPNFVMPEEAGLELPQPGEKVVLQIHYNNVASYKDALDSSGVAMCTVKEPREHKASTLWLGTLEIDVPPGESLTTFGDCETGSRIDEPVTILTNWPHMHESGTAIKTELFRGGDLDDPQTLVEIPQWNFENQIYYPQTPAIRVEPGDILRTTCTFRNDGNQPISFGEGTGDEMCFDFPIVYPIDAFDLENPIGPPELGRYCMSGISGGFP